MVIAPAKTGNASNSRSVVIKTLHANRGTCSSHIVFGRMLRIVMIKLSELMIEEAPAKCNDRMAKSTDAPE